jgi:tetratricopeptide (TPR) repeat protein
VNTQEKIILVSAETRVTAANSAWALSLPAKALAEFDQAILSNELDSEKSEIIKFQKAIIHYQEERHDEALMISQKLSSELSEHSNLHSKVQALIAHCLIRMGSIAQAEEPLVAAFTSAPYQHRSEFAFQIGELLVKLGRWEDAESYLKTIDNSEDLAGQAARILAEISLSNKSYDRASNIIEQGLISFPENFKDAWSYYARASLAANKKDYPKLELILQEARQKLAPSDTWLNMLEADYEITLAKSKEANSL